MGFLKSRRHAHKNSGQNVPPELTDESTTPASTQPTHRGDQILIAAAGIFKAVVNITHHDAAPRKTLDALILLSNNRLTIKKAERLLQHAEYSPLAANLFDDETKMAAFKAAVEISMVALDISRAQENLLLRLATDLFGGNILTSKKLLTSILTDSPYEESTLPPSERDAALSVLGITDSVDATQTKKIYIQLMKQYHPDVLRAKADGSNLSRHKDKAAEINAAYDFVVGRRATFP